MCPLRMRETFGDKTTLAKRNVDSEEPDSVLTPGGSENCEAESDTAQFGPFSFRFWSSLALSESNTSVTSVTWNL